MIYKFFIFTLLINFNLLLSIYSVSPDGVGVCSRPKISIGYSRYSNTEYFCCDGYYEKDNECKLLCPQGCVHGDCVFDLCTNCALGFGGVNCNQTCPNGRFGLNCDNDCNCILDSNCNKNYKICNCNSNSIENECKEICKCRSKCKSGLIGKNCNIECPEYKYGDLCLNDCLCNKNGTDMCNNETGECKCSDHYYGIHCERHCTGNLKCSSHTNCTCEKTIDQSISMLTDELQRITNESMIHKNYSEVEIDRLKTKKNLIIFFFVSIVIILFLIIIKINFKTKKIKKELRSFTIRYSNDKNHFDNPIYSSNLETDFNNTQKKANLEKQSFRNNFLEKFNFLTKSLLTKKDQNENDSNLIVENLDIYSTINDIKIEHDKINEDKIDIN